MAVGLLRPDRGHRLRARSGRLVESGILRAKQLIGALPDGLALPQRLSGTELLTYLGLLRGMPGESSASARPTARRPRPGASGARADRRLPYGMRKKIGLASALLHGPRVLVLDEPFEAVDPVSAAVAAGHPGQLHRGGRDGRDEHPRDGAGRAGLGSRRGDGARTDSADRDACGGARRADARGRVRRTWSARRRHGGCHGSRPDRAAPYRLAESDGQDQSGHAADRRRAGFCSQPLGTIWLGLVAYPNQTAATDVLALVFCCGWPPVGAERAWRATPVLRPELFSLLAARPASAGAVAAGRRAARPGWGVHGDRVLRAHRAGGWWWGAAATAVGVVGSPVVAEVLASVLSTIAGARSLGPGSRRGAPTSAPIVTAGRAERGRGRERRCFPRWTRRFAAVRLRGWVTCWTSATDGLGSGRRAGGRARRLAGRLWIVGRGWPCSR